ncbi:MAG: restriction endonuclease subunit S [Planctomycetes bacterium]|nr:restriction endonuclease subunit S [Planctomycetota bacterium]
MTDGLKDKFRVAIIDILSANPSVERIVLFGSRAMETFTIASDVDIALFGDELTPTDQSKLAAAVDELSMPQQVDLLLYNSITKKELLQHIEEHGVEWFARKPPNSASRPRNPKSSTSSSGPIWRRLGMADEWRQSTLDRLGRIVTGKTPPSKDGDFFGGTIPFVTPTDFDGRRIIAETGRYLTEEGVASVSNARIPACAVMVTCIGSDMGKAAIAGRDCLTNQQINSIVLNSENDYRYVYYHLSHRKAEIRSRASGSAQPILNKTGFGALGIDIPPLREQQAIACILGSLDDKIELNRRMNRTLEGMARAIFKSWFVDFEPVRAKAAGQQPPGLKPDLANLVPDHFEDSELGEIPKGWKARALPEIIQVNPTRSLPKGTTAPYLDMSNMPTDGPSPDAWIMREAGSGMKFINGDTLVARITPCLENGKTAFVSFLDDGQTGWGSTEYIVLRPKGDIPPVFAYLLARWDDFRTFSIHQMTGSSGRQRVPADSLTKFKLATPDIDSPLFTELGKLIVPLFGRIETAIEESRTLAALRDALLPKLISGELRVPDAERIVGRCS